MMKNLFKTILFVFLTIVNISTLLSQNTNTKGKISNTIEHLGMTMEYTIEGDFVYNSNRNRISCVPNGTITISGTFYNGITVGNNRKSDLSYPKSIYVKDGFLKVTAETVEVGHGATKSFNLTFRVPQSAKGKTTIRFSGTPFWIDRYTKAKNYVPVAGQIRSTSYEVEVSESLRKDDCKPSGVSISDVHGEVFVIPADNPDDFYFAEPGKMLCMGDIVETRGNSGAILSLRDMTTYVLSSNSNARIGDKDDESSNIGLLTGHVFANIKRMLKDGSMDIEMSQAVAGIKGTSLFISDDGNTSTVKVVSGSVEVTPKGGRPVMLNSEEAITIRNRQAGNKTKFNAKQEIERFGRKQRQWIQKDMGANYATMLGWKSHKIGNVSFSVPPSWKHDVFRDGNQRTDIFWIGKSLDNPTYGLSIETVGNYDEEDAFFKAQGYSRKSISGKPVKQIANNEFIYILFPKIGRTNKGVVFNFISGNKNGFKNMDDIISTIKIN